MNLPLLYRIVAVIAMGALIGGCKRSSNPSPPSRQPTTATAPIATTGPTRFEYSKIYMGMKTRLVVYASDETQAVNACRAAFNRVGEIDQVASDYRKDSELMRLCASAAEHPVKLSDDLFTLLTEAQKIARLSDGAFDITVGPYVQLWRKARKDKTLPSPEEVAAAGKQVGWQKLEIDPAAHTAHLAVPGMKLDLGGIAKGYAGDCAIQTLRENGITSALFEAGGDIVTSDAPPGTDGWKIELVDAGADMPQSITIHNAAVSTSGDTMQFVEINGKHYSHVVDPHTGIGLTSRSMATIVAPKGLWSDPLSKPATMLKGDQLAELLKHFPGTRAYVRVLAPERPKAE
jgi:thiamine biosynthesis lipoprotein